MLICVVKADDSHWMSLLLVYIKVGMFPMNAMGHVLGRPICFHNLHSFFLS